MSLYIDAYEWARKAGIGDRYPFLDGNPVDLVHAAIVAISELNRRGLSIKRSIDLDSNDSDYLTVSRY